MKDNQAERKEWGYFETESNGVFRVKYAIHVDSLNLDPTETPVKIELKSGSSLTLHRFEIAQNSLFYSISDSSASIELSEIGKILIYDKFTTQDFWITTGNSFLTGAAIANFPASSRDSFEEAGKSALIGGSIFIVLGNLLEYHTSKNTPIEVIFVGGIKEFNLR